MSEPPSSVGKELPAPPTTANESSNQFIANKIYQFLEDTELIYSYVKLYAILAEEQNEKQQAPIHPANELKSLVFHLYRACKKPEFVEEDLLNAREHLLRAFYDSHQIAISTYALKIRDKVKKYKRETLSKIFPDYYTAIKPQILKN